MSLPAGWVQDEKGQLPSWGYKIMKASSNKNLLSVALGVVSLLAFGDLAKMEVVVVDDATGLPLTNVTEGGRLHAFRVFKAEDREEQYLLRAKLLADGIPATSFCTGANETGGGQGKIDMMTKLEAKDWPRDNSEWRHSDMKNVAFYFTHKLYEVVAGIRKAE